MDGWSICIDGYCIYCSGVLMGGWMNGWSICIDGVLYIL